MPFRLWLRQIAYDRTLKAWRHHRGTARRAVGENVRTPLISKAMTAATAATRVQTGCTR